MAKRVIQACFILSLLSLAAGSACAQESPKQRKTLTVEVGFQQGVDDNPQGNEQRSYFWELTPRVEFRQSLPRGFLTLEYRPTVRRFSEFSVNDRLDHQLDLDLNYRLSKGWGVDLRTSLLRSNNPFLRVAGDAGGRSTPEGVLFAPDRSFVGPVRRFTRWQSDVAFAYLLGPRSRVNFGAQYFRETQEAELLPDQNTHNFWAQYQKQYSRNKFFAGLYSYQVLQSSLDELRVRTHSVIFLHTYQFRPGTDLALFAGPQYSLVDARPTAIVFLFFFPVQLRLPVEDTITGVALGGLFRHRLNERTWWTASLSQRVSGGAVTGTVRQREVRLDLQRQLRRRLSLGFAGYLADSRPLVSAGFDIPRRTLGFSTNFGYALNRRVQIGASYDFSRFASGAEQVRALLSRNRVTVGLRYSLGTITLGR